MHRWNAERLGDPIGVVAGCHRGQIEEPLHHFILRNRFQDLAQIGGGCSGWRGHFVQPSARQGKNAALRIVPLDAVLDLGLTQGNHGARLSQLDLRLGRERFLVLEGRIDGTARRFTLAYPNVMKRQLGEGPAPFCRSEARLLKGEGQLRDLLAAEVPVFRVLQ